MFQNSISSCCQEARRGVRDPQLQTRGPRFLVPRRIVLQGLPKELRKLRTRRHRLRTQVSFEKAAVFTYFKPEIVPSHMHDKCSLPFFDIRWISANIQHFGGHPAQVTLLGRGSGATMVTALTASAEAKGLFAKVWASNGAGVFGNNTLKDAHSNNYVRDNK